MAEFVWQNETLKRWGLQEYALEHSTATKFYLFQADMNELFFLTIEGIWIVGIKPDFPFINIRKVPREVLKTKGPCECNDKIVFDRYYCINSKKTHQTLKKCLRTLFFSFTTSFLRARFL